jgi:hypothetical protein
MTTPTVHARVTDIKERMLELHKWLESIADCVEDNPAKDDSGAIAQLNVIETGVTAMALKAEDLYMEIREDTEAT